MFQSAPSLSGGGIHGQSPRACYSSCFNPPPPSREGESPDGIVLRTTNNVSIRPLPLGRGNLQRAATNRIVRPFQSAPSLSGGGIMGGACLGSTILVSIRPLPLGRGNRYFWPGC